MNESPADRVAQPRLLTRFGGPLLLLLTGVFLAVWSWGKWCDPIVDFGRELYVPWQLAGGKVLYRDLAWFNGPLSPWLNTIFFKLFGTGLATLVWCNLAIMGLLTALIYRFTRQLTDRLVALVCGLLFLVIFGFGRLHPLGNYCFVTPYSHGATHGFTLALVMLFLLHQAFRQRNLLTLAGAGCCLGLVFLTKPEIFAATATGALTFILLDIIYRRPRLFTLKGILLFSSAVLLPVAGALLVLANAMPIDHALLGIAGGWPATLAGKLSSLLFYRQYMGMDKPWFNLFITFAWAAGTAIVVLLPALLGSRYLTTDKNPKLPLLFAVGTALLTLCFFIFLPLQDAARPLPMFLATALLVGIYRLHHGFSSRPNGISALAVITFSLALLLKMILNVRLGLYGFVLALPATLTIAALLLHTIPRLLTTRGWSGNIFRGAMLGLLGLLLSAHLVLSLNHYATQKYPVGKGVDTFFTDHRGKVLADFLQIIKRYEHRPDLRLAVLPEGIMLNYLTRRPSPVRHINYMPPEVLLYGEEKILHDLQASPPDLIAFTCRPTPEYGYHCFGQGYGEKIQAWINQHYTNLGSARLPRKEDWILPGAWIILLRHKK